MFFLQFPPVFPIFKKNYDINQKKKKKMTLFNEPARLKKY